MSSSHVVKFPASCHDSGRVNTVSVYDNGKVRNVFSFSPQGQGQCQWQWQYFLSVTGDIVKTCLWRSQWKMRLWLDMRNEKKKLICILKKTTLITWIRPFLCSPPPRYLAREYGLNGATNQENAQVQLSIVDFLFLVIRQIFNCQLSGRRDCGRDQRHAAGNSKSTLVKACPPDSRSKSWQYCKILTILQYIAI